MRGQCLGEGQGLLEDGEAWRWCGHVGRRCGRCDARLGQCRKGCNGGRVGDAPNLDVPVCDVHEGGAHAQGVWALGVVCRREVENLEGNVVSRWASLHGVEIGVAVLDSELGQVVEVDAQVGWESAQVGPDEEVPGVARQVSHAGRNSGGEQASGRLLDRLDGRPSGVGSQDRGAMHVQVSLGEAGHGGGAVDHEAVALAQIGPDAVRVDLQVPFGLVGVGGVCCEHHFGHRGFYLTAGGVSRSRNKRSFLTKLSQISPHRDCGWSLSIQRQLVRRKRARERCL